MEAITVYLNDKPDILTLDDLLARFPSGTGLFLANEKDAEGKTSWSLEATPTIEFIESEGVWPWVSGQAWYGPTSQSVINLADEALRKVKR